MIGTTFQRRIGVQVGQVVSLAVTLGLSVGIFFLGLFFIRKPQVPTRLFTFGMFPESHFGMWWSRITGYLFCTVCVFYWILTPFYLIALFRQQH